MILRRFRDWMRVISPSEYLVLVVVTCAVALYGLGVVEEAMGSRRAWETTGAFLELLVCTAIVAYVAIRVQYFHPVWNRAYGTWLANTPWRHPQRLPLGPLTLVWQDAVVVALFTALKAFSYFPLVIVPVGFLALYGLVHAAFLCHVRIYWTAYVSLFLLGCTILAIPMTWVMLAFAGLMYVPVYFGLQQMLARFPFEPKERSIFLSPIVLTAEKERLQPQGLLAGWPAPPARVERRKWSISHGQAALVGAMVSWLFFCIGYHVRDNIAFETGMRNAVVFAVLISVALRTAIYVAGYVPPISVFGRVATGRLIIPGYDIVLVAPLVVLVVAWLMMWAAAYAGIPLILSGPATAGIAVWLALALPPQRETWQLTGHHRIAYRFRAAVFHQANAIKQQ